MLPFTKQESVMVIPTLHRCALAMLVMAGTHSTAFAASPTSCTGHFLDVPALLENRSDTTTSPLLAQVKAPRLQLRTASGNYQVGSAMLVDRQGQPDGFFVMVKKDDGSFTALLDTSGHAGVVTGNADGTQCFAEEPATTAQDDDAVTDPRLDAALQNVLRQNPAPASGAPVTITVLAGFSQKAVQEVGDPQRFALAQIETLNLALANAGVGHIRIVLAGISTTPTDYPIDAQTLARLNDIFPNHPKADLIAAFFAPPGTVIGGIAYVNGNLSITRIITTDTFAHEVGHNLGAGGNHCNSGGTDAYNFGYTTGQYSSIMCRQAAKFLSFSNPDKLAPDGKPLGHARYADMARVWNTNAPNKSGGGGHDMTEPVLLASQSDPQQCLDVLDGKMEPGAKVGMWSCNQDNPNQRWYKTYYNDRISFRLAAKPSLCLYADPTGDRNRPLILTEGGCSDIAWIAQDKALKIYGNNEYLYLFRNQNNQVRAISGTPSDANPGLYWLTLTRY